MRIMTFKTHNIALALNFIKHMHLQKNVHQNSSEAGQSSTLCDTS